MISVEQLESLGKSGKIVRECLQNSEPFFVLRAKDLLSVMAVRNYLKLIEDYGPYDPEFQVELYDQVEVMRQWQRDNPSQIKYPD